MADVTVWETNTVPALANNPSFLRQSYTLVTAGQTVFTLTLFTYTPGSHKIMVFCNGVFQIDFAETSSTVITLGFTNLLVGDKVDIVGFV